MEIIPNYRRKELNAEVCSVSLQSKQRRNISVISHIEREDIVLKKAYEGSIIVLMDKDKYLAESYRQLSDERFYQKLDPDPTDNISDTITKTLHTSTMFKINEIGNNVY